MSVSDRWHTRTPRQVPDPDSGQLVPVQPCREHKLYPSTDHGKGDRWQVRWRDEHGKQCSANRPKKGGTKNDVDPEIYAVALDAKITAELNAGTYIDPGAGDVTFRTFAEEVVANRTLDPGTRIATRGRLERHVYPVIGGKPLKVLSKRPSLIQALVHRLEAELAPSHIAVVMAHVTMVFAVAVEDELVAKNPCRSSAVVLPPVVKKLIVPWTAAQVAAMRTQLAAEHAAMVDLGAGIGLRQGEILGLSPDDIDWVSGVVHVQRQVKKVANVFVFALPKGGKVRDVPLPESVRAALTAHAKEYPAAAVKLPWLEPNGETVTARLYFSRPGGRPVDRDRLNASWRRGRVLAGIAAAPVAGERVDAREHGMKALRHYFASALLTEGESVKAVALWMGHHNASITLNYYAHLMPQSEVRMRNIIDGALSKISEESARNVPAGDG